MKVSNYRLTVTFSGGYKEHIIFAGINEENEEKTIANQFYNTYVRNAESWCMNGLIVFNDKVDCIRVYHIGYVEVPDEEVENFHKERE